MKCRVCGCELNPAKRYCEKCGALVEGPVKANAGEFAWNTIDFPKPRKMQDIEMVWPGMNTPSSEKYMNKDASEGFVSHTSDDDLDAKPQRKEEPAQSQMQQPQMQYTAPQMTWTMPGTVWTTPAQQQVVIPQPYNVQPVQPVQPMQPAQPVQPVQPVYVQPLYMTQPIPVQTIQTIPGMAPVQTIPGIAPVQTFPGMMPVQQAAQPMPQVGSVNLDSWLDEQLKENGGEIKDKDQFFTFYKKNEDFQKLLDEEYARYKDKFNTNADSLKVKSALAAATLAGLEDTIPGKKTQQGQTKAFSAEDLKKAAEASAQEAHKDIVNTGALTDFDKMILEGTTNTAETGDQTLVISNEELKKEISEIAEKVEAAYGRQDLEAMAAARRAFLQKEGLASDDQTSAVEIRSIFDEWDKEREASEKKAKKKKGGFGKFLLILLILIALFCGADYASVSLLDEGPVTEFFTTVNNKGEELLNKIETKIGIKEDEPVVPEKELTLQEQAAQLANTNIEDLTCDSTVSKFSPQGQYDFQGLGSMTIVDDEETIVDVTETLVKYNCSWIDYVNTGTDITCFDYLRADGDAFRAASNYDGLGKVKETFKKLNIGEMRKDSKYVYVFADEYIIVKKGNTTTEVPSRMIYQMELIGDMYKIVQYDSYM